MHAKLDKVLGRHKFQRFRDVMAADALEQQSSPQGSGVFLKEETYQPVHATFPARQGGS
jgi:hypothetical protein